MIESVIDYDLSVPAFRSHYRFYIDVIYTEHVINFFIRLSLIAQPNDERDSPDNL